MQGQEQINSSDEMWDELKHRAGILLDKLESGDYAELSAAIDDLHDERDESIYRGLGKLTRGLHDALVNFEIDTESTAGGLANGGSNTINARDRLGYVIELTQNSADKTMDMVEEGIPVVTQLGEQANSLRDDWGRLIRREIAPGDFKGLYYKVDQFLELSANSSGELSEKLNAILIAQDYQDLTGQVIKKVITLVQDVEERLVELMKVASNIEQLAGVVGSQDQDSVEDPQDRDIAAEGPQINAEQRADVVAGQDEVDDLLSSLGF